MARRELDLIGTIQHTAQGGAMTVGLLGGVGTNANPALTTKADENFFDYRMKSSCATGTARGIYAKLYLTGGSGGEAGRFFTEVSAAAPADTVNAMHNSLQFGTSVGNVTGQSSVMRNTYMVPHRSLTGTNSVLQAEIWADGTNSSNGGQLSFLRCNLGGDATGVGKLNAGAGSVSFLALDGVTVGAAASSSVVQATAGDLVVSHVLRIKINDVDYYLLMRNAIT